MLNLANSFRLRNKLKEKISQLQQIVASTEFTKDKGTEENLLNTGGIPLKQVIDNIENLMLHLKNLNVAIAKANVVNTENLVELETAKAFIAYYDKLVKETRNLKTHRMEMNATAGYDKVELEPIVDQQKLISSLEEWKKVKDRLEELLAESNFKTEVHYDESIIKTLL